MREKSVGGGEERGLAGAVWRAESVGETGGVLRDGAGGAGDVLQVEAEGIEEHFFCGDSAALLRGFRGVEIGDDFGDIGKAFLRFAARGEVGGIVSAESFDAAKHVVAAGFAVVHRVSAVGVFC